MICPVRTILPSTPPAGSGRARLVALVAVLGLALSCLLPSAALADPAPQTRPPWVRPTGTPGPAAPAQRHQPRAVSSVTRVLDFGELPFQPVDGLTYSGVTFGFTIASSPSSDATYHGSGPGSLTYVQDPSLEGNSDGVLTLTFATPTASLEFGLARDTNLPLTPGANVELRDSGNSLIGTFPVNMPMGETGFNETLFTYSGVSVKTAIISFTFASGTNRFALDNLTYEMPDPTPTSTAIATSTSTATTTATATATPTVGVAATSTTTGGATATATSTTTATVSSVPPGTATTTGTPAATATSTNGGTVFVPVDGSKSTTFQTTVTQNGQPVSGVQVVFSAPTSGPSGYFQTVVIVGSDRTARAASGSASSFGISDTQGVAISAPFISNGIPGTYQVVAESAGGQRVNFTVVNQAIVPTPVVPELPPAWLFGTGLLALGGFGLSRRRHRR